MFARTARIRTAEEGPYVPGGTFDRLVRAGHALDAPFVSRTRAIAEGALRDADNARPPMDAGITGGMSLFGGPAGSG